MVGLASTRYEQGNLVTPRRRKGPTDIPGGNCETRLNLLKKPNSKNAGKKHVGIILKGEGRGTRARLAPVVLADHRSNRSRHGDRVVYYRKRWKKLLKSDTPNRKAKRKIISKIGRGERPHIHKQRTTTRKESCEPSGAFMMS